MDNPLKQTIDCMGVITYLAQEIKRQRLGRTALMKLLYLLQEVEGVPLGYRFTLYSYGPYDRHVLNDLGFAESWDAIREEIIHFPKSYGYKITPGKKAKSILKYAKSFLEQHEQALQRVVQTFGDFPSSDLELLSTLIYADREFYESKEELTEERLIEMVHSSKPYFSEEYIREKIEWLWTRGYFKQVSKADRVPAGIR
jgi:hypothetical protein